MKDLQGHSAAAFSYSFNGDSSGFDDDDDSENMTQLPPPQLPLLEAHQLDERERTSISDEMLLEEEESLSFCGASYERRQRASASSGRKNFINCFGSKNNNPQQSINNKPTDLTGSNINNYYYDHLPRDRGHANAAAHDYADEDDDDEDADDDDVDEDDSLAELDLHHHHHHDHHHQNHNHLLNQQQQLELEEEHKPRSRPNKPTSSPIQVPARRTRKDFYGMKLNMLRAEEAAALNELAEVETLPADDSSTRSSTATTRTSSNTSASSSGGGGGGAPDNSADFSPVRSGERNRPPIESMPAFEDDDAFLEREFNDNHYNHYLLDGEDDEHLTAEENPMRLFASIQALAKSLHEDAELFGSLPPKRMLESPIRSIAFV